MKVKPKTGPALFFCVDEDVLFHSCSTTEGEHYGDFVNYPYSHYDLWLKNYQQKYKVDFDYYPRGRVIYRKTDHTFLIYYDKCIKSQLNLILKKYQDEHYELNYDEHYQCYLCNKNYVRLY